MNVLRRIWARLRPQKQASAERPVARYNMHPGSLYHGVYHGVQGLESIELSFDDKPAEDWVSEWFNQWASQTWTLGTTFVGTSAFGVREDAEKVEGESASIADMVNDIVREAWGD